LAAKPFSSSSSFARASSGAVSSAARSVREAEFTLSGARGMRFCGMATVYLAHDLALDRKVAIKVLAPALLAMGEGMVERFKREARTAAALSHRTSSRSMRSRIASRFSTS